MQLLKITLCKFLGFLTILINQFVVAYEPASLVDDKGNKIYKIEKIDYAFYYPIWMPTIKEMYGSELAVRESFAPSAMVDTNGDLYTITLFTFQTKEGPVFKISKYCNGSYSTSISTFYPWEKIPGITPQCLSEPSFDHSNFSDIPVTIDEEKKMFKDYIHNAFMPCLAQEIDGGSDYIYGFVYVPPTRLMNVQVDTKQYSGAEYGSTEGMLFFKIKKNGLVNLTTTYTPHTKYRCFQYSRLFPRCVKHKIDGEAIQPYFGNFAACYNSKTNNIHLYHGADLTKTQDDYSPSNPNICHSVFSTSGICSGFTLADDRIWQNLHINPRFVQCGDYSYFMCTNDGYIPGLFMQSISNDSLWLKIKGVCPYIYLDGGAVKGGWSFSRYNFDFLVLDAGDEKNNIWCVLGFQGQNSYSGLTAAQGWSSTYCNFSYGNASLFIWSFPITNNTISYTIEDPSYGVKFDTIDRGNSNGCTYAAYPEYIQNVIYTTECGSNSALKPQEAGNSNRRLYLNTQKMCVYKNYIIYAYCYPGKSGKGNHLYIGYAPYIITSDSQLRLLTKIEFKDKEDNSFITDCDRIISLDCKNGHIWLTYMANNNTEYKYFYIKASDLVKE